MGTLRERAGQLKEKRPGYGAVLDFYVLVRESQAASRTSMRVSAVKVNRDRKRLPPGKGFPLVEKGDLPIDLESSGNLFHSLCRLASAANPHMAAQVEKIDRNLLNGTLDLEALLAENWNEQMIGQAAADLGLDSHALLFLVASSAKPSIEAAREQLCRDLDLETWRKSCCPVCGSRPTLSLLKGDAGMRYSLCSYCGCEWRIDRLSCPVCGGRDQDSLEYFHGEGEEACRMDLCDACRHYIKTIDYRILEESDPCLEDLATLHLDVLAVQKGYRRSVPNPWTG
jgi:FdhE protein